MSSKPSVPRTPPQRAADAQQLGGVSSAQTPAIVAVPDALHPPGIRSIHAVSPSRPFADRPTAATPGSQSVDVQSAFAMPSDRSVPSGSRSLTSSVAIQGLDSTPFVARTSSYVDHGPTTWKQAIPFLQDDLNRHHIKVKRTDWIKAILWKDVTEWTEKLQGLKDEVKVDLTSYTAASSESQYYDPFVRIANKILQRCEEYIEVSGSELPPFPIDDLKFYKNETVVIKGDHDGNSHPNRKPDVIALRHRRLGEASRDATRTSDQIHWSDVLLAVEFKVLKNTVSLDFSRLSSLTSVPPLTRALSSTV